jgi:DNA-binding NtrC family response regulator
VAGKILIVDQNPNYREILRTLLEKRGYSVHVLEEAYTIVNEIRKRRYNIIFLDSETGGTKQRGLFAKVRKECPGCNIILITSKRGDAFIKEAMDAGAYGCINKPYNPDEVLTMVQHIIPNQRSGKEEDEN